MAKTEELSNDHLWLAFSFPSNHKTKQISINIVRKGIATKEQAFEEAYMHAHVWSEHGMVLLSLPEGTTKDEAAKIPNTLDRDLIKELLMGTETGETLEIPFETLGTPEMDECVAKQKEARARRKKSRPAKKREFRKMTMEDIQKLRAASQKKEDQA